MVTWAQVRRTSAPGLKPGKEFEMKKFMVVILTDESETIAKFFNEYTEAKQAMMNAECGLGWYSELYERIEIEAEDYAGKEYRLIEA